MKEHIADEEISALLDGALDGAARARAQAHLEGCGACRHELESLRHLKGLLAAAPRRTLPADLALNLEHRYVGTRPWTAAFMNPAFWVPVGAVAAAALAFSVWSRSLSPAGDLPLEPLLAAHERYSAEALVPEPNLVASSYSDPLTLTYADAADGTTE